MLFTANRDQCYRNSPPAVTSRVGSTAVTIDVDEIQYSTLWLHCGTLKTQTLIKLLM